MNAKVCQIQLNCVLIPTNVNVLQNVLKVDHPPKRNYSSLTHPPQTLFQLIILDLYSNLETFTTKKNRTIAFLPPRISFYWNIFILRSGQWTLNSSRRSEKKKNKKGKRDDTSNILRKTSNHAGGVFVFRSTTSTVLFFLFCTPMMENGLQPLYLKEHSTQLFDFVSADVQLNTTLQNVKTSLRIHLTNGWRVGVKYIRKWAFNCEVLSFQVDSHGDMAEN